MAGYRPVAVDPRLPNFDDTRIDLHCPPGQLLAAPEANALCQRVGRLFQNQGAEVRIDGEPDPAAPVATEPRTALALELRARETDASSHPFSWLLFVGSLTVLPGVIESSFAQELTVRDASGFPLVTDTFEGRIVTRYGFGSWLGSRVLDLARKKVDRLGKDVAKRDLSNDLYGQLSQHVFNAKMHAEVLQQGAPVSE
jgi:hypothetical protein